MTTNSVKHEMLKLAKKIANKKYENTIDEMEVEENLTVKVLVTAKTHMDIEINKILNEHPEFDSGRFKSMIKEFQVRNSKNEI